MPKEETRICESRYLLSASSKVATLVSGQ